VISRQVSCSCSSVGEHSSGLPVKGSDMACLSNDCHMHMSAFASVPGTVGAAIKDELLASTRSLNTYRVDYFVLRYSPRPACPYLLPFPCFQHCSVEEVLHLEVELSLSRCRRTGVAESFGVFYWLCDCICVLFLGQVQWALWVLGVPCWLSR
jgi:hypothetical protein